MANQNNFVVKNGLTVGNTNVLSISTSSAPTANQIAYVNSSNNLVGVAAPSMANTFLGWNGSSFAFANAGTQITITNDTTTTSNLYPLFSTSTTGTVSSVSTSSPELLFKPSTGELEANVHVSMNGLTVNSNTVSSSYTVQSGQNALSVGPIAVQSGKTVTVSAGSRWVVL
jgi:hypothetical protein